MPLGVASASEDWPLARSSIMVAILFMATSVASRRFTNVNIWNMSRSGELLLSLLVLIIIVKINHFIVFSTVENLMASISPIFPGISVSSLTCFCKSLMSFCNLFNCSFVRAIVNFGKSPIFSFDAGSTTTIVCIDSELAADKTDILFYLEC